MKWYKCPFHEENGEAFFYTKTLTGSSSAPSKYTNRIIYIKKILLGF